ncbi:hypothetical protein EON67_05205 [archaeon]|nr:MAG: hypothetical protein EON67_05205 [archaeon]
MQASNEYPWCGGGNNMCVAAHGWPRAYLAVRLPPPRATKEARHIKPAILAILLTVSLAANEGAYPRSLAMRALV